eukprot:TRINITY_DN6396_c0_g2_i1.p2 TRINITY_DN6396_c0_g2~~TRINITY_DN6396_c0_g2_i1.p2  ORF type:complete len:303 (-),score=30.36 TRINITY_DN6396_c0_g2_i1:345-1253(-)
MSLNNFFIDRQLYKIVGISLAQSCYQKLSSARYFCSQSSPADSDKQESADFGFKQVPKNDKQTLVGNVFSNVASKYDVMNDLMSLGIHRLWKDRFVSMLNPFPGMDHLDVAGGTGDVAFRVLRQLRKIESQRGNERGTVTVADISPEMLKEGERKAQQLGILDDGLKFVECNAEELPMQDESFDSYTIAFGIRNVTNRDQALKEAYRVLRPGGRFLCLEFSPMQTPILKDIYDWYSFNIIPQIGKAVAGDEESYKYLVESIRMFPDKDNYAQMIQTAGFQGVQYTGFSQGIAYVHQGVKLHQ